MPIHRTLLTLTAAAGLWFGAGIALAEDTGPPGPGMGPGSAFCKEHPEQCEGMRAKREAWCKENPEKCEAWKKKRAERRAFCKENPEKCEQQRAEMRKRRDELKSKCAADPEKCDEMKQQMRERWKERQGGGGPPDAD